MHESELIKLARPGRLGESVETIKTWIDVGLIETIKRSGSRKVPAEVVERLKRIEPTNQAAEGLNDSTKH